MNEKEELIKSYDDLSLDYKREELESEVLEMSLIISELLAELDPNFHRIEYNFNDLSKSYANEDEYLKSLYSEIIRLKELLGAYYEFVTNMYYDEEE